MSQFEPSRIIDNTDADSVQQYVEIGSNTYLGTKDGIKYSILPTSDNKFKLCEVAGDTSLRITNCWSEPYAGESKCQNYITPPNNYKTIKLITVKKQSTPCKGQGDESGNSIISTPDSTSRSKNVDSSIPGKNDAFYDSSSALHLESSPTELTYTTLMPRQEQKIESLNTSNYSVPTTYFQFPTPVRTSLTTKSEKYCKSRQKAQLISPQGNPYPQCSPILYPRGRGQRQRRPRQVYYQYRTPVMHSTPTSSTSSSSSLSGSPPISSVDSATNSSISSYNDSQVSLEYPRAPNNTPNSSIEDSEEKQRILNLQWIPQIQTRISNYMQMDPRESHNEKERKRRLRIKKACQVMKNLLPGVCNKTDNATVFENAVHFITFMRETIGSNYDMEFASNFSYINSYIK